jgi:hypothetical protein
MIGFDSVKQSIINSGVNAALNNSGVMRHGLNANYYANHNKPGMAIREGAAALYDAFTGSRK